MSLDEWLLNALHVSSAASNHCCVYTISNTHIAHTATLLLFQAYLLNCSKNMPRDGNSDMEEVSRVNAEGI